MKAKTAKTRKTTKPAKPAEMTTGYTAGTLTQLDMIERMLCQSPEFTTDLERALGSAMIEAESVDAADEEALSDALKTLHEIKRLFSRMRRQVRPVMERTASDRMVAVYGDCELAF